MGAEQTKPAGPDLALGIPIANLPDGHMLAGHVGDAAVVLARRGDEIFAIGASCSHYGGRSRKGSWSTTPCDALGTMPASACARGSFAPPALSPSRAGSRAARPQGLRDN